MESFGVVVSRSIPSLSGIGGVEPQPHNASLSGLFCSAAVRTQRNSRASRKSLKLSGISNFVFSDPGYLDYYYSSGQKIRCGACKEKVKEEKVMKKTSKMLKSLSRDLAVISEMGSDPDNVLVDPVKANVILEAAELLREQLQQFRSEVKELKRRKEQKNRSKAAQLQSRLECDMSSSTSSESGDTDSDCGEVVDTNLLDCNRRAKQIQDASQTIPGTETLALPGTSILQEGTSNDLQASIPKVKSASQGTGAREGNWAVDSGSAERGWSSGIRNSSRDSGGFSGSKTPAAKKIEVCMGGKCKKSGAAMLMEEFQRVLGIEGAVSGCKCMGKCRDGPNVRISNNFDDHVKPATTNQLCIGVGLEDVDFIVDSYLGGSQQKFDPAAAS